jgi:hypothetical protein
LESDITGARGTGGLLIGNFLDFLIATSSYLTAVLTGASFDGLAGTRRIGSVRGEGVTFFSPLMEGALGAGDLSFFSIVAIVFGAGVLSDLRVIDLDAGFFVGAKVRAARADAAVVLDLEVDLAGAAFFEGRPFFEGKAFFETALATERPAPFSRTNL